MQNVSFQNINSLWAFRQTKMNFIIWPFLFSSSKYNGGSRSSAQIALHKSRLNVKIIRTKGKKSLGKVLESVEFVSRRKYLYKTQYLKKVALTKIPLKNVINSSGDIVKSFCWFQYPLYSRCLREVWLAFKTNRIERARRQVSGFVQG